jgi:uncharacterized membrane-anchored protein
VGHNHRVDHGGDNDGRFRDPLAGYRLPRRVDPFAWIFGALLVLITLAYYCTKISHVGLFWTAFILTRPLGAVVGDFLDKPVAKGGLELSRVGATLVLSMAIVALILLIQQQAAPADTRQET